MVFGPSKIPCHMERFASVVRAAELRRIGSQEREMLANYIANLSGDPVTITTPWHGISDMTGIIANIH
jgi:hypothetical protein